MSAQRQRAYVTRPETAQQANERIADKAVRLRFVSRLPLHCECSDPNCDELILIEPAAYRAAVEDGCFLTAPGHGVLGGSVREKQPGYWVQLRQPA
jgi:hypothetical protein